MKSSKRIAVFLLFLVLAALILVTGCMTENPRSATGGAMGVLTLYTEDNYPYNYLENGTLKGITPDLFEKITLYDVKVTEASASKRPDGRWDVTLEVDARKLYADGKGAETEAPLEEVFEVGAFEVEPGRKGYDRSSVMAVERMPLRSGRQTLRLVADRSGGRAHR